MVDGIEMLLTAVTTVTVWVYVGVVIAVTVVLALMVYGGSGDSGAFAT